MVGVLVGVGWSFYQVKSDQAKVWTNPKGPPNNTGTPQTQQQAVLPSKEEVLADLKTAFPKEEAKNIEAAYAKAETEGKKRNSDIIIQKDLAAIQMQSEIYYGGTGNNSYGTPGNSCSVAVFSDPTITKYIASAKTSNGGTAIVCNNSATAFAVQSNMVYDPTYKWCVDSTRNATKSKTALGTNTVCPVAN